jgi:hypothetical protein
LAKQSYDDEGKQDILVYEMDGKLGYDQKLEIRYKRIVFG